MEVVIFWVVLSIVIGIVAGGRGRSALGFFLLSLLLSPLIGLILVALLPPIAKAPVIPGPGDVAQSHRVACPQCAEQILPAAKVCRFCGYQLPTAERAPTHKGDSPPASQGFSYRAGTWAGRLFAGRTDQHRYPPPDKPRSD